MNAVFVAGSVDPGAKHKVARGPIGPIVSHVLSSTVGGALTGLGLGWLGWSAQAVLPSYGWIALLAVLGLLAVSAIVLELRGQVWPLWQRRSQVPREWTLWRSRVRTAGAFGGMIGAAVFTYLDHATAYVLAVMLILPASALSGGVVGAIYGFARAMPLVSAWMRRSRVQTSSEERVWRTAAEALPLLAFASATASYVAAIIYW